MPTDPADIEDGKTYAVFSLKIPVGSKQDRDESGNKLATYSYPPKSGYDAQSDGPIPRYPLPKYSTWSKRTGAQQKNQLTAKDPNDAVKVTHNDMFLSLVSPGSKPANMTIDVYKNQLLMIIKNTTNKVQMEQAVKMYNSLKEQ